MQFTPGQLRAIVGLSRETFRHWKRVLPVYANRKGRSPRFSPGDVLASAIIRCISEKCGVRISHLAEASAVIFDVCNKNAWALLEDCVLVLNASSADCGVFRKAADLPMDRASIVCPFAPVIHELQAELLRSQPISDQKQFYFPPTAVGRRVARSRAK